MDKIATLLRTTEEYVGEWLGIAIFLAPVLLLAYFAFSGDWGGFAKLLNSLINRPLP